MPLDSPFAWTPDIEEAIERHPLIVLPETPLVEAISLISQAHHRTCSLLDSVTSSDLSAKGVRASCVLAIQNQELLGILTERDVVRLTAKAIDFQETTVGDVMVHPIITLPQKSLQDIFAALFLFRRYRIRHLPIVDDARQLVGVISHESIRQVLRPANLLRFRRVSDVMTPQVIHASVTTSILQLAKLMATYRVSCVVITQPDTEGNQQPVGIVTERDIVQFQAFQIDLVKTQAYKVMSTPLFLLSPEDSLWTAHQEMQKRRVGRLVVSWNWGRELGIVTQTSLLRVFDPMEMYGVIEHLQQTIQELEAKPKIRSIDPPNPIEPILTELTTTAPIDSLASTRLITKHQESLLAQLDYIYTNIQFLIAEPNISVPRRIAYLQTILGSIDKIHSDIIDSQ
jgi:CBS domain-containing protein